jgi:hypothetical protein
MFLFSQKDDSSAVPVSNDNVLCEKRNKKVGRKVGKVAKRGLAKNRRERKAQEEKE